MSHKTPGKLILSGEHAVVYGNPALAISIDRYVETTLTQEESSQITLKVSALGIHSTIAINELLGLKERLDRHYQEFTLQKRPIESVLADGAALIFYVIANLFAHQGVTPERGFTITLDSSIPLGCGLGSSAACIVSVMKTLSETFALTLDTETFIRLAKQAEDLRHGYSSGLDIHVCYHECGVLFSKTSQSLRQFRPFRFYAVNTGEPECTTGECVTHARQYLENNASLLNAFKVTTLAIDRALKEEDIATLHTMVKQNHRLLVDIGVVPRHTQRFIEAIEALEGCAKICGAGSIRGDKAGFVMMLADDVIVRELQRDFNYTFEQLRYAPKTECTR